MEIKIEEDMLAASIRGALAASLDSAINGWELRKSISDAMTAELTKHDLPAMIARELDAVLRNEAAAAVRDSIAGIGPVLTEVMRGAMLRSLAELVVSTEHRDAYPSDRAKHVEPTIQRLRAASTARAAFNDEAAE